MADTPEKIPDSFLLEHMKMLQAIINRLAGNSANCKTICVTLSSAILVFATNNKNADALYLAFPVILVMGWLDAFYLSMERMTVDLFRKHSISIQNNAFERSDLFNFKIAGRGWSGIVNATKAFRSNAIWPFYLLLLITVSVILFAHFVQASR